MTDLRLADASVAGLLAFWSLIHIPDEEAQTLLGPGASVPGALLFARRQP